MAAEITIKEHRRKNKKGEWITVKGYTRRVGKKGVHSPKKSSSKPGDEFVQVLNDKLGKTTGPIVTDKFISKEERAKDTRYGSETRIQTFCRLRGIGQKQK